MVLEVDMAANGGTGAVMPGSFQFLADSTTAHVTAVRDAEEDGYWLILHRYISDKFLAYHLTSAGLDTLPVVSATGPVLQHFGQLGFPDRLHYNGSLVASLDGNRLALMASPPANLGMLVELFAFDRASGAVVHQHGIGGLSMGYGIEFSPNGSKLYVHELAPPGGQCPLPSPLGSLNLWQYDIGVLDSLMVQASVYSVTQSCQSGLGSTYHMMALCPDGRIRLRSRRATSAELRCVDVVQFPDSGGAACGFQLAEMTTSIGSRCMTNQCKQYHDSAPGWLGTREELVPDLRVWPNPVAEELWLSWPGAAGQVKVTFTDVLGRVVLSKNIVTNTPATIEVRVLPAGPYVLSCSDEQGSTYSTRVFVADTR
jgi:hypothetical protein